MFMKTQIQIAEEVGVTQQAISAYVKGLARPKYKILKRLLIAVPGSTVELWMEGTPDEIQAAMNSEPACDDTEAAA